MNTWKPGEPVTSTWTDFDNIATWGWKLLDSDKYPEGNYDDTLDNWMAGLNVNPAEGVALEYQNSVTVFIDGIEYQASQARYADVYYPQGGLIVADENYGPKHKAPYLEKQGLPYVKLRQWSDIIYLVWEQQCIAAGTDVGNLQTVLRYSIANEEAEEIIDTIKKRVGGSFGDYSNPLVFSPGQEEFNALLGSPNGAGVAWLLINHKAQLGLKTISSIYLFTSAEPLNPSDVNGVESIAFTIIDYAPRKRDRTDYKDDSWFLLLLNISCISLPNEKLWHSVVCD